MLFWNKIKDGKAEKANKVIDVITLYLPTISLLIYIDIYKNRKHDIMIIWRYQKC